MVGPWPKESHLTCPMILLFLVIYDKSDFYKGDGVIDDYIRYHVTGAHCRITGILDRRRGEIIFFGGDVAPQCRNEKNFIAKYDFDGKKCMDCASNGGNRANRTGPFILP